MPSKSPKKFPKKRHVLIFVMAFYITLKLIVIFTPSESDDAYPEKIKDQIINIVDEIYDY